MSCCGRTSNGPVHSAAGGVRIQTATRGGAHDAGSTFEYLGHNGLTVRGGVTGRSYVFFDTGARVIVDRRDQLSLLQVPLLRHIR